MFAWLARAFSPLDTSATQAAIDEAKQAHCAVRVRARALRIDAGCAGAGQAISGIAERAQRAVNSLRHVYDTTLDEPLPAQMQALVDKLEGTP